MEHEYMIVYEHCLGAKEIPLYKSLAFFELARVFWRRGGFWVMTIRNISTRAWEFYLCTQEC